MNKVLHAATIIQFFVSHNTPRSANTSYYDVDFWGVVGSIACLLGWLASHPQEIWTDKNQNSTFLLQRTFSSGWGLECLRRSFHPSPPHQIEPWHPLTFLIAPSLVRYPSLEDTCRRRSTCKKGWQNTHNLFSGTHWQ